MKNQKQLDCFRLTEKEKKLIRREERYEIILSLLLLVGILIGAFIALWAITELIQ